MAGIVTRFRIVNELGPEIEARIVQALDRGPNAGTIIWGEPGTVFSETIVGTLVFYEASLINESSEALGSMPRSTSRSETFLELANIGYEVVLHTFKDAEAIEPIARNRIVIEDVAKLNESVLVLVLVKSFFRRARRFLGFK